MLPLSLSLSRSLFFKQLKSDYSSSQYDRDPHQALHRQLTVHHRLPFLLVVRPVNSSNISVDALLSSGCRSCSLKATGLCLCQTFHSKTHYHSKRTVQRDP